MKKPDHKKGYPKRRFPFGDKKFEDRKSGEKKSFPLPHSDKDIATQLHRVLVKLDYIEKKLDALAGSGGPSFQRPEQGPRPNFGSQRKSFGQGPGSGPRPDFKDRGSFKPRATFKATCSKCGKPCEVPFMPSGDRPVYCRECFAKRRDGGFMKVFDGQLKAEGAPKAETESAGDGLGAKKPAKAKKAASSKKKAKA